MSATAAAGTGAGLVQRGAKAEGVDHDADWVHERRWWILGVLCLALIIIGIDGTIVNVALPTLTVDLSATSNQLQWIVDAYTIVFAGFLLLAGNTGDRLGRKGVLVAGLGIFAAGSLASAFADSSEVLIATRALQGFGGAFIMPTTLSVLTNVFRDPSERTRAISIWAGVSGLGVAIGPLTGGFLLEHYWWGSIFLINIPILVVAVALVVWLVPRSKDPHAPRLDLLGTALVTVGLISLLYGIIEGPVLGWGSGQVIAGFVGGAVLLTAFAVWELRSDHPILDLTFFKNPRFSAASIAVTLVFFAVFGCLYFLSQYLQFVLGYTALETGWRLMPLAAVLMIGATLSAPLVRWLGSKIVVGLGLGLVAAGLLYMTTVTTTTGYGHVLVTLLVAGVGMALAMAPATDSIMGSLPPAKAGVGSAVNDTTREVGGALGVAVLGSVMNSGYRSAITSNPSYGTLQQASAEAADAVRDSVGGAAIVAGQLPADVARQLMAAADAAFVDSLDSTVVVAAAVALAGALVALLFLPSRPKLELPTEAAADVTVRAGTGDETLQRLAAASSQRLGRRRDLSDATLDVLAEAGYSSLSFGALAGRLGQARDAQQKDDLNKADTVVAAMNTVFEDHPVPDTGWFRQDARRYLLGMAETLSEERAAPVVATLLDAAAQDPGLAGDLRRRLVAPQRAAAAAMVDRAKSRGELPVTADTEVVVDLLVAPLLHRLLVTGVATTEAKIDHTLDLLLCKDIHRSDAQGAAGQAGSSC